MECYAINGGKKLFGEVKISPAKNSCLPIISACAMLNGQIFLQDAPKINDVIVMASIIKDIGGDYQFKENGLKIDCRNISKYTPSIEICSKARASFFMAGALLSKFKRAIMPLPGGCNLGNRPVDIHINALKELNVFCLIDKNYIIFNGEKMKSGRVKLPYPSVGATINVINASVFLKGTTTIENCAKEPEIEDLCKFLNICGCKIKGGGTSFIEIQGVNKTKTSPICFKPISDRIEAGTYMAMVSATMGELVFRIDDYKTIATIVCKLKKGGVKIEYSKNSIYLKAQNQFKNFDITADVYPNFPTDMQPQFTALLLSGKGNCQVCDNVFKERFSYTKELKKMGAKITKISNKINITGGCELNGCQVDCCDLRGGASLITAGLFAKGQTIVKNIEIVKRGYENMCEKLKNVGADISVISI